MLPSEQAGTGQLDDYSPHPGVDPVAIGLSQQLALERAHVQRLLDQAEVDHQIIESLTQQRAEDQAQIANLQQALVTSRQIGAAVGVLMHAHKIGEEEAFDLLRAASHAQHRKLRAVAADVLFTGGLND